MAPHYQAATLIASPSYPNAIAWSSENLVAVASGHLITILNPAALEGPRELVVLRPSDPFPIGVVNREGYVYDADKGNTDAPMDVDFSLDSISNLKKHSSKKVMKPGHDNAVRNGQGKSQHIQTPSSCNGEDKSLPLITAKQYSCREALLSSLIVAWSPVLPSPDRSSYFMGNWCILAVGCKSGSVSFWKIHKPEYYTIDISMVTRDPMLIGVVQAHLSWVTAISWELFSSGPSKPLLLLATGCSDGSSKIWLGDIEGLNQCTCTTEVPLTLVAEVTTDSLAPISSISLSAPAQHQDSVNLAIGRASGSLELWSWNIYRNKIEKIDACDAHDQVDNSAHCWMFNGKHLQEIPLHTYIPELKESIDLTEVSDGCYGLALAPGELMIAVVRSLDPNLLNQMYQARTQKAVVEFIWIGGQFIGIPLDNSVISSLQSAAISETNFSWWGTNILWSLKKYENCARVLVLWDLIAALQGIKKSAPTFLETLMHKWVSEQGNDVMADLWNNLLVRSERELRERLVAFTFAAVLNRAAYLLKGAPVENSWFPVGVAQMYSWASMNDGEVYDGLKFLRTSINDLGDRINSVCEYSVEEYCTYCTAPVPFESADVAMCSGSKPATPPAEAHKIQRQLKSKHVDLPECRTRKRVGSDPGTFPSFDHMIASTNSHHLRALNSSLLTR
ncbi:hypothetical protein E2562_011614 [Oryza meyeriana var. granulata]|uniref:Transcription factor IIIC 90kDa subunit N-terminal domain-containing protein n=1 Tax=Oryza meyeriana var. granulata TaxID=110450 RepID=A0A6G1DW83_9ORYZ|nr:hypothetical protein E2562_011614 [Oryza meyeriana var. granulata]